MSSPAVAAHPPTAAMALTAIERGLLTRVTGSSFERLGRNLRQGLARVLDPADRVLDARAYRSAYTRRRVLYAIIRGASSLDTPPQVWSAEDWGNVRRAYGDKCSFPLMIVAAQGYGVMPGRDYNLPLNTPRLALARESREEDTDAALAATACCNAIPEALACCLSKW